MTEAPALIPFLALFAGVVSLVLRTVKGCYDE